jgi:hypothetical protein
MRHTQPLYSFVRRRSDAKVHGILLVEADLPHFERFTKPTRVERRYRDHDTFVTGERYSERFTCSPGRGFRDSRFGRSIESFAGQWPMWESSSADV